MGPTCGSCIRVFAIVVLALVAVTRSGSAQDINIQSRIDTFTPPVTPPILEPQVQTIVTETIQTQVVTTQETVRRSPDELAALVATRRADTNFKSLSAENQSKTLEELGISRFKTVTRRKVVKNLIKTAKKVVTPPKTTIQFSMPLGLGYETNAFRSPTNIQGDTTLSWSTALAISIPVGDAGHAVNLSAGTTTVRYNRFSVLDFDTVSFSGSYRHILGTSFALPAVQTSGTRTTDTLDIGVSESTSFEPTFGRATINLVTPNATVARRNIPLSDAICGEGDGRRFCYYADVSANLGFTFSDVVPQQNLNGYVAGTLGWRIPAYFLALTLSGRVAAREYTDFPGGRRDLILSGGPGLSYAPNDNFNVALGVSYFQQYSSLDRARWNGFVFISRVTAAFTVSP